MTVPSLPLRLPLVLLLVLLGTPCCVAWLVSPCSSRAVVRSVRVFAEPPQDGSAYYDPQQDPYQQQEAQYDYQQNTEQQYTDQQYTDQQYTDQQYNTEEPSSLIIGDNLQAELGQIQSKYPTSEADYLAAARDRAMQRIQSQEAQTTDADWQAVKASRQDEVVDDWEHSLTEAGNADSQILLPDLPPEEGDDSDEGGGEEPTLLLF